nr:hypothetical protein 3 [Paracoccaceae bacterium]
MFGKLPNDFSYQSASDLVRIGRDNDGGYLVSKSDIEKSDVLIGLGINDDWSFERDFKKITNVELFAYDASISQKHFIKQFIKSLVRIDNPKVALNRIKTILSYRHFFSKSNNHHIQKFVGLETEDKIHCTLKQILDDLMYNNIFLKIDIESSEYRLLETLISYQKRLSGLVIEFHDCDLHLEAITSFIKRFKLNLVHVHANEGAPIRATDGLPLVLELTFSKYCKSFQEPSLPHKLDMPNGKRNDQIQLMIHS